VAARAHVGDADGLPEQIDQPEQELAHRLPPGAHAPTDTTPAAIEHLPTAIHAIYAAAVAAGSTPSFRRRPP
jgi:hypothetical protein